MTHYKTMNIGVIQKFQLVQEPGANYPAGYHGAGDLTHVEGIGMIAALTHESAPNLAILARVEPTTAAVLDELVTLEGYSSEFGLATWEDRVFAFGYDGEILEFNPVTLEITFIADTNHVWRGAAGPVTP